MVVITMKLILLQVVAGLLPVDPEHGGMREGEHFVQVGSMGVMRGGQEPIKEGYLHGVIPLIVI